MWLHQIDSALRTLSIPFAALTAFRLFQNGLHRRYRYLFSYVVLLVPFSAFPEILDVRSASYFWTWVITLPVNLAFEVLVVAELCRLVLEDYRGLSTIGRWGIYAGVALSTLASIVSLMPRITSSISHRSAVLLSLSAFSRGINLSLAIFLILMMLLVSTYPVRLRRNVVLNTVVFAILFFCNTLAALLRTIFDIRIFPVVDTAMSAIGFVAIVLWCFLLTPKGEQLRRETSSPSTPHERTLLARLDSLNRIALTIGTPRS